VTFVPVIVGILGHRGAAVHNARMTETPEARPPRSSEATSEPGTTRPTSERGAIIAWWVGFAAHLVIGIWYAASGLVAPPWAVAVLLAIWVLVLIVGLRLRTRRPWLMLAAPVLDVVIWVAAISAGESFLGWTA
jgi:hypothetical protein